MQQQQPQQHDAANLVLLAERARSMHAAAAAEPVPSPCISVCRMVAASGLCEGCFRTLEEIAGWSRMDDVHKRMAWTRIEQRLAAETTP